jgi:hypothetical protein
MGKKNAFPLKMKFMSFLDFDGFMMMMRMMMMVVVVVVVVMKVVSTGNVYIIKLDNVGVWESLMLYIDDNIDNNQCQHQVTTLIPYMCLEIRIFKNVCAKVIESRY